MQHCTLYILVTGLPDYLVTVTYLLSNSCYVTAGSATIVLYAFSALMLLVGQQWWGAGVVICLERGAVLVYGLADATATHCLLLQ